MDKWIEGTFVKRHNRFLATCVVEGQPCQVHVANTGRLKELLIEGAPVMLTDDFKPERKTRYTLRRVFAFNRWVSIDSGEPNKLALKWLNAGTINLGQGGHTFKPEVTYKACRFDLYCEAIDLFVEVKGVTLVEEGVAMFPDAPTSRGTKHLNHLIDHCQGGGRGAVLFFIQREDAKVFTPNQNKDPEFASVLKRAVAEGVSVRAFTMTYKGTDASYVAEVPVVFYD